MTTPAHIHIDSGTQPTVETTLVSLIVPTHDMSCLPHNFLSSITKQKLPPGYTLEIVIINDGGSNAAKTGIKDQHSVRVIENPTSKGRAVARNQGAAESRGAWLYFLDSDCVLAHSEVIQQHLNTLLAGSDASIGKITSTQAGFWTRIREHISPSAGTKPNISSLATANCMIRRDIFCKAGGYDDRYKGYGFEDRDLLARIYKAGGRISVTSPAEVLHSDEDLTVIGYCRKMNEAARITAPIFSADHPDIYLASKYALFDARLRGRLFIRFARTMAPLGRWLIKTAEPMPYTNWLPFFIRKKMVNLAGGLAYLLGSINIKI